MECPGSPLRVLFECDFCEGVFHTVRALRAHRYKVHGIQSNAEVMVEVEHVDCQMHTINMAAYGDHGSSNISFPEVSDEETVATTDDSVVICTDSEVGERIPQLKPAKPKQKKRWKSTAFNPKKRKRKKKEELPKNRAVAKKRRLGAMPSCFGNAPTVVEIPSDVNDELENNADNSVEDIDEIGGHIDVIDNTTGEHFRVFRQDIGGDSNSEEHTNREESAEEQMGVLNEMEHVKGTSNAGNNIDLLMSIYEDVQVANMSKRCDTDTEVTLSCNGDDMGSSVSAGEHEEEFSLLQSVSQDATDVPTTSIPSSHSIKQSLLDSCEQDSVLTEPYEDSPDQDGDGTRFQTFHEALRTNLPSELDRKIPNNKSTINLVGDSHYCILQDDMKTKHENMANRSKVITEAVAPMEESCSSIQHQPRITETSKSFPAKRTPRASLPGMKKKVTPRTKTKARLKLNLHKSPNKSPTKTVSHVNKFLQPLKDSGSPAAESPPHLIPIMAMPLDDSPIQKVPKVRLKRTNSKEFEAYMIPVEEDDERMPSLEMQSNTPSEVVKDQSDLMSEPPLLSDHSQTVSPFEDSIKSLSTLPNLPNSAIQLNQQAGSLETSDLKEPEDLLKGPENAIQSDENAFRSSCEDDEDNHLEAELDKTPENVDPDMPPLVPLTCENAIEMLEESSSFMLNRGNESSAFHPPNKINHSSDDQEPNNLQSHSKETAQIMMNTEKPNHSAILSEDKHPCLSHNESDSNKLALNLTEVESTDVPAEDSTLRRTRNRLKYVDAPKDVSATGLKKLKREMPDVNMESLFVCEFCGKAYQTQRHHLAHEAKHRGGKVFKCPYCAYSSVGKQDIELHYRTEHGCTADKARELAAGDLEYFHAKEESVNSTQKDAASMEKPSSVQVVKKWKRPTSPWIYRRKRKIKRLQNNSKPLKNDKSSNGENKSLTSRASKQVISENVQPKEPTDEEMGLPASRICRPRRNSQPKPLIIPPSTVEACVPSNSGSTSTPKIVKRQIVSATDESDAKILAPVVKKLLLPKNISPRRLKPFKLKPCLKVIDSLADPYEFRDSDEEILNLSSPLSVRSNKKRLSSASPMRTYQGRMKSPLKSAMRKKLSANEKCNLRKSSRHRVDKEVNQITDQISESAPKSSVKSAIYGESSQKSSSKISSVSEHPKKAVNASTPNNGSPESVESEPPSFVSKPVGKATLKSASKAYRKNSMRFPTRLQNAKSAPETKLDNSVKSKLDDDPRANLLKKDMLDKSADDTKTVITVQEISSVSKQVLKVAVSKSVSETGESDLGARYIESYSCEKSIINTELAAKIQPTTSKRKKKNFNRPFNQSYKRKKKKKNILHPVVAKIVGTKSPGENVDGIQTVDKIQTEGLIESNDTSVKVLHSEKDTKQEQPSVNSAKSNHKTIEMLSASKTILEVKDIKIEEVQNDKTSDTGTDGILKSVPNVIGESEPIPAVIIEEQNATVETKDKSQLGHMKNCCIVLKRLSESSIERDVSKMISLHSKPMMSSKSSTIKPMVNNLTIVGNFTTETAEKSDISVVNGELVPEDVTTVCPSSTAGVLKRRQSVKDSNVETKAISAELAVDTGSKAIFDQNPMESNANLLGSTSEKPLNKVAKLPSLLHSSKYKDQFVDVKDKVVTKCSHANNSSDRLARSESAERRRPGLVHRRHLTLDSDADDDVGYHSSGSLDQVSHDESYDSFGYLDGKSRRCSKAQIRNLTLARDLKLEGGETTGGDFMYSHIRSFMDALFKKNPSAKALINSESPATTSAIESISKPPTDIVKEESKLDVPVAEPTRRRTRSFRSNSSSTSGNMPVLSPSLPMIPKVKLEPPDVMSQDPVSSFATKLSQFKFKVTPKASQKKPNTRSSRNKMSSQINKADLAAVTIKKEDISLAKLTYNLTSGTNDVATGSQENGVPKPDAATPQTPSSAKSDGRSIWDLLLPDIRTNTVSPQVTSGSSKVTADEIKTGGDQVNKCDRVQNYPQCYSGGNGSGPGERIIPVLRCVAQNRDNSVLGGTTASVSCCALSKESCKFRRKFRSKRREDCAQLLNNTKYCDDELLPNLCTCHDVTSCHGNSCLHCKGIQDGCHSCENDAHKPYARTRMVKHKRPLAGMYRRTRQTQLNTPQGNLLWQQSYTYPVHSHTDDCLYGGCPV